MLECHCREKASSASQGGSSSSTSTEFNDQFVGQRADATNVLQELCNSGNIAPKPTTQMPAKSPKLDEETYKERMELLLLLLRRINEVSVIEVGVEAWREGQKNDIQLLNALWKLLNTCYNRDYFTFVRELLPFVILNYTVLPHDPSHE